MKKSEMMPMIAMLGILMLISINTVWAMPPTVIDSSWSKSVVQLNDMEFALIVFEIEFDQDIFLNGSAINSPALSGSLNEEDSEDNMPALTTLASGMSTINMTIPGQFETWTSVVFESDGAPNYIMTAMVTSDSAATFLGAIGGYRFPETIESNAIAFVKIYGTRSSSNGMGWNYIGMNEQQIGAAEKMMFLHSDFANAAGEKVDGNTKIVFPEKERKTRCSYTGVTEFLKALDFLMEEADSMQTKAAMQSFEFLAGSLESRNILSACKKVVEPFFDTRQKSISKRPAQHCNYDLGTEEFASSSCCNSSLQYFECCPKTSYTARVNVLGNLNTDIVERECEDPGYIQNYIKDVIKETQRASPPEVSRNDVQDRFEKFKNTCDSLMWGRCSSSADCFKGMKCASWGYCQVPEGKGTEIALECYWENMLDEMKDSLEIAWRVQGEDALKAKLGEVLITQDCDGEGSDDFRARWDEESQRMVAGNQTGCLQEKVCNWDRSITNEADCLSTNPVENLEVCVQCWGGGSCDRRSQKAYCRVPTFSSQVNCESAGLYWYENVQTEDGYCVDTTRESIDQCQPLNICPAHGLVDGNRRFTSCGVQIAHGCYTADLDQTQCDAVEKIVTIDSKDFELKWHDKAANGTGACAVLSESSETTAFLSSDCAALNNTELISGTNTSYAFELFLGYEWFRGDYATKDSCELGRCTFEGKNGEWVDTSGWSKQQCMAHKSCTQRCPQCVQHGNNGESLCFSETMNSTECDAIDGHWEHQIWLENGDWENWETSARCKLPSGLSEAECLALPGVADPYFFSCKIEGTKTCALRPIELQGQIWGCDESDWAQCETKESCEGAGFCDDRWELQTFDEINDVYVHGACFVQSEMQENGEWPAQCNTQTSTVNGQPLEWSRFNAECRDLAIASESVCNDIKGARWRNMSTNAEECNAHKKSCDVGKGPWSNAFNAEECSECKGKPLDNYLWTAGEWVGSEMESYTWTNKSWTSKRRWANTIDHNAIWSKVIEPAVAFELKDLYYESITKKYSKWTKILEKVACACTRGSESRDCGFGVPEKVFIGKKEVSPGKSDILEGDSGSLVFTAKSSESNIDAGRRRLLSSNVTLGSGEVQTFTIAEISANSLATGTGSYAIVQNSDNYIVGQIAGDCIDIEGLVNAVNVTVTVNFRTDISIESEYTVPAIGYITTSNNVSVVMVHSNITDEVYDSSDVGSITTMQILNDGSFCPCVLAEDWEEYSEEQSSATDDSSSAQESSSEAESSVESTATPVEGSVASESSGINAAAQNTPADGVFLALLLLLVSTLM